MGSLHMQCVCGRLRRRRGWGSTPLQSCITSWAHGPLASPRTLLPTPLPPQTPSSVTTNAATRAQVDKALNAGAGEPAAPGGGGETRWQEKLGAVLCVRPPCLQCCTPTHCEGGGGLGQGAAGRQSNAPAPPYLTTSLPASSACTPCQCLLVWHGQQGHRPLCAERLKRMDALRSTCAFGWHVRTCARTHARTRTHTHTYIHTHTHTLSSAAALEQSCSAGEAHNATNERHMQQVKRRPPPPPIAHRTHFFLPPGPPLSAPAAAAPAVVVPPGMT